MPIFELSADVIFPPPHLAGPDGLLAFGGDLSAKRLLLAYSLGIFPWFSENSPILWWSPDPRLVIFPQEFHVSKSLRKVIRQDRFRITFDRAFDEVIRLCACNTRKGRESTWITADMIDAYCELHEVGHAHSVECWKGSDLVGGVYGVSLGALFFGESMFSLESNASKVALFQLMQGVGGLEFLLIDCQVRSEHVLSLGAREIPRERFLSMVQAGLLHPGRIGKWS